MLSDRSRRQVERLLDEAEAAMRQLDWATVRQRVQAVLALDPDDPDARSYLAAALRASDGPEASDTAPPATGSPSAASAPESFCDDRYRVVRFLGEGGKKRVYLAHDTKLDRDVAFALIKTDGLDDEGLVPKGAAACIGALPGAIENIFAIDQGGSYD